MERGGPEKGTLWAAALLAAATLLFYWRYVPFPGSLYARVVRDFWPIYHTWPYYELSKRIFAEGYFPLWNALNACGTPLLGCFQASPFHPARMLLYIFPFWQVIDIWLLLRMFISGLGTYWFLRWRGASWQGAVPAALAWMFSGSVTDYINLHYLDVDLLLPFGLLVFGWMARGGGLASVVSSALVVFFAFLGGNPTSVLYFLLFVTLYYFYTTYRLREDVGGAWARFLASACFSGLLGAVALLPFHEMLAYSWDYHPAGLWNIALDSRYILSLFGPEIFPGPDSAAAPLLQRAPYIGTVVLVLAVSGLFCLRRMGSGASFFAGFAAVFAGLIWGVMPFYMVSFLPILARTANFRYALPEVAFCAAILAGMSWDHITHYKERIWKYALPPSVLTVAAVVLISIKNAGTLDLPIRGVGILILCAFAWSATLLMLLHRRKALPGILLFGLLSALWFVEASLHFNYLPLLAPKDPAHWKRKPIENMERLDNKRTYALDGLVYPNLNLAHNIEDLRYFAALYVARYRHFMSAVNDQTPDEALMDFIPHNFISLRPRRLESKLLDLAGAGIITSDESLPPNRLIERLLERGDVRAPGDEYVLKRRIKIRSDVRKALFQHPPSRLTAWAPAGELRFGVGMDPSRFDEEGDGVTFMIIERDGESERCVFARHIDPARNFWDQWWLDYAITVKKDVKLSFITLSGADFRNDWAAWGDLRSSALEGSTRYEPLDLMPERIYRNLTAMPRAFAVGRVIVKGERGCVKELARGLDFRKVACIEGHRAYEARLGLGDPAGASIKWRRMASDKTVVDIELQKRALVVITETYYPGWKAFIGDDNELAIYPANGMFRAVAAPPGAHRITFVYKPVSFRIGLWTTLVSLLAMAVAYGKRIREE